MMKKVAIQGVKGAFHDIVASEYFTSPIEIVECSTFQELCNKLKNDECDTAVMAIENTLAGSILPNFTLLEEHGFYVVGEVYLRIKMNLMAIPGQKTQDLYEIQSHPIALLQCREYLKSLGNIHLNEINDTAEGAKILEQRNQQGIGIIASKRAAELYNLEILKSGIETDKKNYTRFLILSKSSTPIQRANKASLVFVLKHEVGSLVDILTILKCHELNMTKILSTPIIGRPYEYAFHIDLTWENKSYFDNAMDIVRRNVAKLRILGTYKQGNKPTFED